MANIWPKEAIENLGRPLNRWDECPNCGKSAASHAYKPATNELQCIANVEKTTAQEWTKKQILESIQQEAERMYLAGFELKDAQAAEEAKARGRRRAREKYLDRQIVKSATETPIDLKRKYFDE